MALRNKHSRLWLIPVFMVLLLWGCGEDIGLVNDDEHARMVVDSMPAAEVEFATTIDEDGSMTFEFDNNVLNLVLRNYPRLGDADLPNGGLDLRISRITVEITDSIGVSWDGIVPNNVAFVIPPNGAVPISISPLFPMALRNQIVERYLWASDVCNTLYAEPMRLALSEYDLDLTISVEELLPGGGTGESYTKHINGAAYLTHTGDYNYPITTVPDFCPIVVP